MRIVVPGILATCVAIAATPAASKCRCVANGARFEEGQIACIRTPQGARPARCEKVLNNSAWKFIDGPCRQTSSLVSTARVAPAAPAARQHE